jgi:hypothetical protein
MESKLVIVQSFGTAMEAEVAKSALEAAGIAAVIQADAAGGMKPHLAWSGGGFRLLVHEKDASDARELLKPPAEP